MTNPLILDLMGYGCQPLSMKSRFVYVVILSPSGSAGEFQFIGKLWETRGIAARIPELHLACF